ncbi:MAG: hypothetical protein KJ607_10360, partial [Bacteroidetes bacterium]|nr:hypothetical protein [Bacteroidota bacterium]
MIFLLLLINVSARAQNASFVQPSDLLKESDIEIIVPEIVIESIPLEIRITLCNEKHYQDFNNRNTEVLINGHSSVVRFEEGRASVNYTPSVGEDLRITIGGNTYNRDINAIPLWLSILPPLIAILMALFIREVYSSLFTGLLVGTTIIYLYRDL